MSKKALRYRKQPHQQEDQEYEELVKLRQVKALTEAQGHYLLSIKENIITFGVGPAGTGKSFVAAASACDALINHQITRIICTRPVVTAGEELGFLPGDLNEKYSPYLAPLMDIFEERLGKSHVKKLIDSKAIVGMPMAFMRGSTFKDCYVILDEAQNTTPTQMKMFLTRCGRGSKLIIDGDESQKDIQTRSGLTDAILRLQHLRGVGVVRFAREDIVRRDIVQDIIEAYED